MLDEISDDRASFVNRMQTTEADQIGIVAAKYDLLIPLASTHLAGEKDHTTIVGTHNSLLVDPRVFRMVLQFIESGKLRV